MKKILVTGGTDGIGKGMVLHYLKENCQVIAVGSSLEKGQILIEEVNTMGKKDSFTFIQANLSLVQENLRVVKMVSEQFDCLDELVLCAASLKPQPSYMETTEGFEFTFALYYLSRYVLCYELKNLLEKSASPVIVNVCAPGMSGTVQWNDIQMKQSYNGLNAQFHGSRLNDLLGVSFHAKDTVQKIKYILFNPMAARTSGASKMSEGNFFMSLSMKLYYKLMGKNVDEIVSMIQTIIQNTTTSTFVAYKLEKSVNMNMDTFNKENAFKLGQLPLA